MQFPDIAYLRSPQKNGKYCFPLRELHYLFYNHSSHFYPKMMIKHKEKSPLILSKLFLNSSLAPHTNEVYLTKRWCRWKSEHMFRYYYYWQLYDTWLSLKVSTSFHPTRLKRGRFCFSFRTFSIVTSSPESIRGRITKRVSRLSLQLHWLFISVIAVFQSKKKKSPMCLD